MKRIVFAVALAAIFHAALAAEPLVLDRDASIALALEQNRTLRSAEVALGTAQREADNPLKALLPSVSASASLNHSDTLFSDPVIDRSGWTFSSGLNVSLPLQAGLADSITQTRLDLDAQRITVEQARMQLVNQVEREFSYLLAAKSNVEILALGRDLAQQRFEQTRTSFENGRTSELAVLQAQVSAANHEPTYLAAASAYRARLQSFLIVLGLDPRAEVDLEGELVAEKADFDAEELIDRYLESRIDIRTQVAMVRSLENSRSLLAANTRLPSVSLSAGWSTSVSDPFARASRETGAWSDALTVGLGISVPLDGHIPNSSTDLSVKAMDDRITQARIQLEDLRESARAEIINLVAQLETSWSTMELSRLNVELSGRAYEMSEEAYRRGTTDRLTVEDSQQSYLSANQSYLVSRYEYLAGLISLRYALGGEQYELIAD